MILSFLHPLGIFSEFGVDPDDIILINEKGDLNDGTGFDRDGLGAALRAISFFSGRGLGYLEIHFDGEREGEKVVIKIEGCYFRIGLEPFCALAHDRFRER